MMAMLGQWLGLDTSPQRTSSSPSNSSGGIVIGSPKRRKEQSNSPSNHRKTKSDELLGDFDVMRFLAEVDERLKEEHLLLSRAELDRLATLYAQACADECIMLSDIIEHFELENEKLRHRLALASPSSAAVDAMKAQRNALVC